jgi:predicted regulator of Ras-like GTPase activity (Roadblock/LC7/MglB family)
LADALRKSGALDEALAVALAGLVRHPRYVAGRLTLGRVLEAQGDLRGAAQEYERARSLDPLNLSSQVHLARALVALGEYDEAHQVVDDVLRWHPRTPDLDEVIARLVSSPAEAEELPAVIAKTPVEETVVAALTECPTVAAALVFRRDGLPLAGSLDRAVADDVVAALTANALLAAEEYLRGAGFESLDDVLVETERGVMQIVWGGAYAAAIRFRPNAPLGEAVEETRRALADLPEFARRPAELERRTA